METRPAPKRRSTEDDVECLGLWLCDAEKTAHFLRGRRIQDVIVHMAVRLPAPGPSNDGLFCLINAWLSSVA
jgi:hypothetical protein